MSEVTMSESASAEEAPKSAGSFAQTLSRGIRMLEVVAAAPHAPTIAEVAESLGVHRSIVYRILRTLEEHTLLRRDTTGRIHPAAGLTELARGVEANLQAAALPVLTDVANELDMSTFVTVAEQGDCFTLVTIEPLRGHAVTQRPGTRHRLDRGAPGIALLAGLSEPELIDMNVDDEVIALAAQARQRGYTTSENEVIDGVSSVAVPLRVKGQAAAALAVVYPSRDIDVAELAAQLSSGADRIRARLGG